MKKLIINIILAIAIFSPVNINAQNRNNHFVTANIEIINEKDTNRFEERKLDGEELEGFCGDPHIKSTMLFIGRLLYIAKIAVPLILIIMGSIDFGKAVISSNQETMKKSATAFVTRIVAGIIIFVIPTVVNFIFDLIPVKTGYTACRICILTPSRCGSIMPNANPDKAGDLTTDVDRVK